MISTPTFDPAVCDMFVDFRTACSLGADAEAPGLAKITGTILSEREAGGEIHRERIGRVVGCRIYGERVFAGGLSVWDHVEDRGEAIENYYRALFEDGYSYVNLVRGQFNDPLCAEVLVLHSVYLLPRARGHGLGVMAARRFIDLFRHIEGMVICRPFPAQFDVTAAQHCRWDLSGLSRDRATALGKVRALARRLGFTRLGSSAYFGLCPKQYLRSPMPQEPHPDARSGR